ncbi:isochorismatase family protein [bacterium]|nr:MAG: isochorismatase family protein [bacterium]
MGARFHPDLRLPEDVIVVSKGIGENEDGFSTFDGIAGDGRDFLGCLREMEVQHLYVGGLATDYCVKYTVLDALKRGIRVTLLLDAVRGVDLMPGDAEGAIREMVTAGAVTATLESLAKEE